MKRIDSPDRALQRVNRGGGATLRRRSLGLAIVLASLILALASPLTLAQSLPPFTGTFIDPTVRMNGACTNETTCEAEATNYYKAIGALDASGNPTQTGTLAGWKSTYGFSADPTHPVSGEIRAVYYNNGDLQFGRDMHCLSSGGNTPSLVACYVSNYAGPLRSISNTASTFPQNTVSSPQTAISNAHFNNGRIATVAMVYTSSPQVPQANVQFWVFDKSLNGNVNDGPLLNFAILDTQKTQDPTGQGRKAAPGTCLACHGGTYNKTSHLVVNASFLPFDTPTFIFGSPSNDIFNIFISEFAQREVFRQLNQLVYSATYSEPTIFSLITGWYSWCGGFNGDGCFIDDVRHPYYPSATCPGNANDPTTASCGWPQTQSAQAFYQSVPRVYCRGCHIAQADVFNMEYFLGWTGAAATIHSIVLVGSSPQMPFGEVPYNAFSQNPNAVSALAAFLAANP
jgi:hypothetical protein